MILLKQEKELVKQAQDLTKMRKLSCPARPIFPCAMPPRYLVWNTHVTNSFSLLLVQCI